MGGPHCGKMGGGQYEEGKIGIHKDERVS